MGHAEAYLFIVREGDFNSGGIGATVLEGVGDGLFGHHQSGVCGLRADLEPCHRVVGECEFDVANAIPQITKLLEGRQQLGGRRGFGLELGRNPVELLTDLRERIGERLMDRLIGDRVSTVVVFRDVPSLRKSEW